MRFKYTSKEKIAEIPKGAGVYSFWDKKDLLYIGKAANLRERVKTHFRQPNWRDNLFMEQVHKIGYIETDSEIEALLLESALIKERSPKYNVLWKDGKNYFFVLITHEGLPRVLITHQQNQKGAYIGPFVDGKAIKRTLRNLRRVFPYYTKKHDKKPCQYCHLGLCPGPEPNKEKYKKDIKNLAAVLQGKKTSVLKKLQKEMQKASKNQHYEKAKELRDQIQDLEVIFSHAKVFRPAEEKQPIHWPTIEAYLQKILDTKKRIARVEAYDISNIQGKEATSSMPVFVNGVPAKDQYRKFKIKVAGTPNDFAMLEETITRRLKHPEWPYPDLMIIDGGKGQLSAALRAAENSKSEIRNSKLGRIQIAAIAKKHNELFIPGRPTPLLLKDMPQPVSNFILRMRDEAHRFAISYHRTLRRVDLLGKKK